MIENENLHRDVSMLIAKIVDEILVNGGRVHEEG